MSVVETLIFDRTASDVQRIAAFVSASQKRPLTDAELQQWNAYAVRGAYNAEDLNRVGEAAIYVNAYLSTVQDSIDAYRESLGVASDAVFIAPIKEPAEDIAPRLNFARGDHPTVILADASNTMHAAAVVAACADITFEVDVARMTYRGANDVERALYDAYHHGKNAEETRKDKADRIAAAWYYSGDLFCGDLS